MDLNQIKRDSKFTQIIFFKKEQIYMLHTFIFKGIKAGKGT
jgi:hypothetical protein